MQEFQSIEPEVKGCQCFRNSLTPFPKANGELNKGKGTSKISQEYQKEDWHWMQEESIRGKWYGNRCANKNRAFCPHLKKTKFLKFLDSI